MKPPYLLTLFFLFVFVLPVSATMYTGEITKLDDLYPSYLVHLSFQDFGGVSDDDFMNTFRELIIKNFERADGAVTKTGTFTCDRLTTPYTTCFTGTYEVTSTQVTIASNGDNDPTCGVILCEFTFTPALDATFKRGIRYSYAGPGRTLLQISSGYPIYGNYWWYFGEYANETVNETTTLVLYVRDLGTSQYVQGVDWTLTDYTQSESYSETNSYIPTTVEWEEGSIINISVSKDNYETAYTGNITIPDLVEGGAFSITVYLEPTCTAPAGSECVYIKTFWWDPINVPSSDLIPLDGVSVTINNQTKTSVQGTTLFYITSSAGNKTYTCTKSGFESVIDYLTVGTSSVNGACVMVPTAITPTTSPIPTSPVPVTTSGPGGVIIDRLAGIFGPLFLAALIIFTFMIGGAYGMSQFGGGNIAWIGILGGGAMGFIVDIWFGLIDFMWLMVMLFLGAMLFAVYIGKGWGGG